MSIKSGCPVVAFFLGALTIAEAAGPSFDDEVGPLLLRRCVECHSGLEPEGGLDLTTFEGLRRGGESGAVIDVDEPIHSLMLQRVLTGEMPPEDPLELEESNLIREWVTSGSKVGDAISRSLRCHDRQARRHRLVVAPASPTPVGSAAEP